MFLRCLYGSLTIMCDYFRFQPVSNDRWKLCQPVSNDAMFAMHHSSLILEHEFVQLLMKGLAEVISSNGQMWDQSFFFTEQECINTVNTSHPFWDGTGHQIGRIFGKVPNGSWTSPPTPQNGPYTQIGIFSVDWVQIETLFYFGNHWKENRDFHVIKVQW